MTIHDVLPWVEVAQYTAVIAGTIFAVVQYREAKKARRQEKAAAIMLRYSETVLKISGVEASLSGNRDISRIIDKIDKRSPLSFALYEQKEYGITKADVNRYRDFLEKTDISILDKIVDEKRISYMETLPAHIKSNLPESCSIGQLAVIVLNETEQLCMEIESAAVDDEYLYGSLHQTLTPFIHKMAIMIQSLNESSLSEENYYPYTKRLYNRWVIKESDNYRKMKERLRGRAKKKP
jgi:hypothetical protein